MQRNMKQHRELNPRAHSFALTLYFLVVQFKPRPNDFLFPTWGLRITLIAFG